MKIQSNMYINNPDMTSRNIEKKENSSHALVQEDDIQISDSARKLVETARNKVSDFHTMHFSSIMSEEPACNCSGTYISFTFLSPASLALNKNTDS